MVELRQCDMILMDASPLIYLAKARHLDLLLNFASHIYVADEVYFECAERWLKPFMTDGDAPQDAIQIAEFIRANEKNISVKETQLGQQLRKLRLANEKVDIQNAGEMAAVSLFDRRREITGGRDPVLVIFEDTEVPLRFANKDVHLMTTFALFVAMERAGYIESALDAFDSIPKGSRPSEIAVDKSIMGDTTYRKLLSPRR